MTQADIVKRQKEFTQRILNEAEAQIEGSFQSQLRTLRRTIGSALWLDTLDKDEWQMIRDGILPVLLREFEQREGFSASLANPSLAWELEPTHKWGIKAEDVRQRIGEKGNSDDIELCNCSNCDVCGAARWNARRRIEEVTK